MKRSKSIFRMKFSMRYVEIEYNGSILKMVENREKCIVQENQTVLNNPISTKRLGKFSYDRR